MEVFALGLKLKEEGAATVQAATQKLNTELNRTAGAANNAAKAVQTAQLNAAKGSLAFGGMARSMAQTGSAASLMSGGIVEAGTHIATFLGPQGVLLMAVTGLVVAVRNAFKTIREDVLKEQQGMIADSRKFFAQMSALGTATSREQLTEALTQISRGQLFVISEQALRILPESERQAALAERGLVRLREEYARLQTQQSELIALEARWTAGERSQELASALSTARTNAKGLPELMGQYALAIDNLGRMAETANSRLLQLDVTIKDKYFTKQGSLDALMGKLPRFSLLEQARTGGRGVTSIGGSVSAAAAQFREQTRQLVDETAVDAANLQSQIRDTLAQSIGDGITDGIAAGFERGFATGRIGEGFKSLAGTMLSGLGSAMIQFGKASLVASTLMQEIRDSLSALTPKGAVVASLAMIAAGGALRGVAQSAFGGMGGGGGMAVTPTTPFGIPMTGAAMGPTQLIFGATSATTAAGMTPRQAMNVTLIGPNDPTAQRAMQELMRNANQRGTLG